MHTHARRSPEVCNKMRTRSTQQCVLHVYYMARTHAHLGEVMARRRDYKSQPVLAPSPPLHFIITISASFKCNVYFALLDVVLLIFKHKCRNHVSYPNVAPCIIHLGTMCLWELLNLGGVRLLSLRLFKRLTVRDIHTLMTPVTC